MDTTFKNTLRAASFFLCGALTLGTLQATARAADHGLPSERVSYADLDISKPAGAKTLYPDSFCQQLSDIGGGRPGHNGRPADTPPSQNPLSDTLIRYFCSA